MTLQKINPENLSTPHGHAHVVVATGSKMVFASGQVAIDPAEQLLADDYEGQGYHAVANGYLAIAAAGAGPKEVVRMTVYVVDPTPANLDKLFAGLARAVKDAGGSTAAMTLVGITGLYRPDLVVEVELTAVTD
jgi:enamine deaminase RidA (YjgF/YER057c/UK114 family)